MKILVLFDLGDPPPSDQNYGMEVYEYEWVNEWDVRYALRKLGHQADFFGLYDDIDSLREEIRKKKPDLVFNLCEAFRADRALEPNVISFLELLKIPYTGATPFCLHLCRDKALSKTLLSHHDIRVPDYSVSSYKDFIEGEGPVFNEATRKFPLFIKPLGLDGSEGVTDSSYCKTAREAQAQVARLHKKYRCDVIAEEYIAGREFYVGMVGSDLDNLVVFHPRELIFEDATDDSPVFATYKAKWDEDFRWHWGVKTQFARKLSAQTLKRIETASRRIFTVLGLRGYTRLDFRLTPDGEPVFLEANPNPCIARLEDYSLAAKKAGISYNDLIRRIVEYANQ